jgi:tetratricopeptide (TPR) repeat protein
MLPDAQGLDLTTTDEAAAAAYRHAVDAYLNYRTDAGGLAEQARTLDPNFVMGHVLVGYLALLPLDTGRIATARDALRRSRPHLRDATHRERLHVVALSYWIEGDLDRALSVWESILAAHPHDLLAFRLHHNTAFWHGLPHQMHKISEIILPYWSADLPGYATVLACNAFALEECGYYLAAEQAARSALDHHPGNLWATHALTHVMEMQGRRDEGIRFLKKVESHWGPANHFKHHLWWHRAMFHLERRELDEVLDLYDRSFRRLSSPLSELLPDLYNDILNATSMLFRLELQGVAVGHRWEELADKAEARMGDCLASLTLPHWMMALAGAQRWSAADRLLETIRTTSPTQYGDRQFILAEVALPVSKAVLYHRRGKHAQVIDVLAPVLPLIQRLGGSHAQRDVFEQLLVDATMKSGQDDVLRQHLMELDRLHPVQSTQRIGYAKAARHIARQIA